MDDEACPAGHYPGEREKDCPYCFPDDWDCSEQGHVQGPCGVCAVCSHLGCGLRLTLDARFECGKEDGHMPRHEATVEVEPGIFLTVAWHALDARPETIAKHAEEYAEEIQDGI